jgi:hypothetical protein
MGEGPKAGGLQRARDYPMHIEARHPVLFNSVMAILVGVMWWVFVSWVLGLILAVVWAAVRSLGWRPDGRFRRKYEERFGISADSSRRSS